MAFNIGSVVAEVSKRINIPSGISGTNMNGLVIGAINTVINITGQNPGSVNIQEKFNEVIVCLTTAGVAGVNEGDSNAGGNSSTGKGYKIGDFDFKGDNFNTGANSRMALAAAKWEACADRELRNLGYKMDLAKANG